MKISEHAELYYLTRQTARKIRKVDEIASICVSCEGRCKAQGNLIACPGKEKWSK